MKKNNKFYLIELIILIFIIMFKILNDKIPSHYAYLINIIFWFLLAIFLFVMGGFPRNKNFYRKSSMKMVFIVFLLYILVIYLLGLFIGFVKNLYFYDFIVLIKKVLPISLFIIASEIARYLFFKHNPSKLQIVIFTLELVILNIIIGVSGYNITNMQQVFVISSMIVVPTFAREVVCSYLNYNIGFAPTIIYKLLFSLYSYLVPFIPDLNDYLNSIFGIIIPFVIYYQTKKIVKYREKYGLYAKKSFSKTFGIVLLSFLTIIIILISGIFKYQLMAIATGSMEPIYYRGDAIILEKVSPDSIQEGDILVYNVSGGIVTHRVIEIVEKNGKRIFHTKGDNNETDDKIDILEQDVKGVVRYVVKYIGYPTILFNELLESK